MTGDDYSIRVENISGDQNKIGHEIHHHRPPQRHLTPELSRLVVERITRDRPIMVHYPMGNHEAEVLAKELHTYLAAQGYEMDGDASWFGGGTPAPNTVHIGPFDGERVWRVYLGPAA